MVDFSDTVQTEELVQEVREARHEFYRYGIAFDPNFQTALLEAELNGAKIYDYDNGGIDQEALKPVFEKGGTRFHGEIAGSLYKISVQRLVL